MPSDNHGHPLGYTMNRGLYEFVSTNVQVQLRRFYLLALPNKVG